MTSPMPSWLNSTATWRSLTVAGQLSFGKVTNSLIHCCRKWPKFTRLFIRAMFSLKAFSVQLDMFSTRNVVRLPHTRLTRFALLLSWSPYGIGQTIIFSCCGLFFFPSFFLCSPYVIGQTIIFSSCSFFLSFFLLSFFFFPRLISAVGDWMFTILWHMAWP